MLADFDFIPINAPAENLERIANMDINTETLDENSNDSSLPTSKLVYDAIKNLTGGGGTSDQNGLQVWKPNTKYDVGNEVLFLNTTDLNSAYFYYAKCIKAHTSSNETNYTPSSEYWQYKYVYVPYAKSAQNDMNGKEIHSTYATKEELSEAIGRALEGDY